MRVGWWAAQLETELSQGDVVVDVLLGTSVHPAVPLVKSTGQRGARIWAQSEWKPNPEGVGNFLAEGRILPALVVSHSCEIDKQVRNKRVLVAPVAPADRLEPKLREAVFRQRKYAFVPLPDVPTLGDSYADLRLISFVPREVLRDDRRVASMSEDGRDLLHTRLFAFFTRKDLAGSV
jgi:hypothetical protein